MSSNVVNQVAYLQTTRIFPKDPELLVVELGKSYLDIATTVNTRVISIFPTRRPAISGEEWFLRNNQKQQGFRQVYPITGTGSYPHGINIATIGGFTKIYGTFTDGSFWYTLPWVSVVAANAQINVFVNATNIVITGGGGAGQPVIVSGFVVLEWISLP